MQKSVAYASFVIATLRRRWTGEHARRNLLGLRISLNRAYPPGKAMVHLLRLLARLRGSRLTYPKKCGEHIPVGDRQNNRIQIFDQDGSFIDQWFQFSRPSGIYIDKHDVIYVADSESESAAKNHDGWKRGIRIGSARDGKVTAFIPDADPKGASSAAEGVAVGRHGGIYGAEVGPRDVKKYVKKCVKKCFNVRLSTSSASDFQI